MTLLSARDARSACSVGWLVMATGWTSPGCSSEPSAPAPEPVSRVSSATYVNGSFETGSAGAAPPAPWVISDYLNPNPNGFTVQTPQTLSGLNLVTQGMACTTNSDCLNSEYGTCQSSVCKPSSKTITLNGSNQADPTLGPSASLRWPRYGSQCALVNQLGSLSNVNALSQTMTVSAADIDPFDGQIHIRMAIAPVLEDGGHMPNQQPYFFLQVTDVTRAAVLYQDLGSAADTSVPWQTVTIGTGSGSKSYHYTDWQLVDVAPGSAAIAVNDVVTLEIIAAGCSIGGHIGELYVDGVGTTIPGLTVTGKGPGQVNAGASITYDLTYTNGSASTESGVTIDFTTPTNTTFQSLTPLPGAVCTPPAVGTSGTVKCAFPNPVLPGDNDIFTVTVLVSPGATGSIVAADYEIHSTTETPLLGNKITTALGCASDGQCGAGLWCDVAAKSCVPTLANGAAMPDDPQHGTPTLDGTCKPSAASLVCTSQVCDTADNSCGYANGHGPCTSSSGGVVCRSAVCVGGLCEECGTSADCTNGMVCSPSHVCTSAPPDAGIGALDAGGPEAGGPEAGGLDAGVWDSGVPGPGSSDAAIDAGAGSEASTDASTSDGSTAGDGPTEGLADATGAPSESGAAGEAGTAVTGSGGGCACSAGATARGGTPWLVAAGLLVLPGIRRRRSGRAKPRPTSTSRMPCP